MSPSFPFHFARNQRDVKNTGPAAEVLEIRGVKANRWQCKFNGETEDKLRVSLPEAIA